LIVNGWKNIENREWPTRVRGRVLLHAGKTMTRADYEACQIFVASFAPSLSAAIPRPCDLARGGIVGGTTILDCVSSHSSEWFVGSWGFVLDESRPLPFVPCPGRLGFFDLPSISSKPAPVRATLPSAGPFDAGSNAAFPPDRRPTEAIVACRKVLI
jgi:hypothetical protein